MRTSLMFSAVLIGIAISPEMIDRINRLLESNKYFAVFVFAALFFDIIEGLGGRSEERY